MSIFIINYMYYKIQGIKRSKVPKLEDFEN